MIKIEKQDFKPIEFDQFENRYKTVLSNNNQIIKEKMKWLKLQVEFLK